MPTKKQIYLDYAAATPVDKRVLSAMEPYFSDHFHNPSALYQKANQARDVVNKARAEIAQHLGCRPSEIFFTSGGTEANNLALYGVMERHKGKKLLASSIEHESIRACAKQYDSSEIAVDGKGRLQLDDLGRKISDDVVLISVIYANNEIGTIQDIKQLSKIIADVRQARIKRNIKTPIYLHSDACQAIAYEDINVARLGVDMMTLNSGKIYGPKGCGALYIRAGVDLLPLLKGGGQEFGLRSGTENVASVVGFAAALSLVRENRALEIKRLRALQKSFLDQFKRSGLKYELNGDLANRLVNNLNISFYGVDNERLLFALDELGIMVATGSACSASNDEPSHVLHAMGLSDAAIRSSLRLSMGNQTTQEDVNYTTEQIVKIIKNYRS